VARALARYSTHAFGEASRLLYVALLEAKLLVASAGGTGSEAGGGQDLRLIATPGEGDGPTLLAYTTERSFALGGQAEAFAVAPARGLFGFALRNGAERVSLDSGGPVAATLERWELEALAEGQVPRARRRALSMSPADPETVPGLVGVLAETFSAGSVFLLEEEEQGDARRLYLGLTLPPPIDIGELAGRLSAFVPRGDGVSLLRLTAEEAQELQAAGVPSLP